MYDTLTNLNHKCFNITQGCVVLRVTLLLKHRLYFGLLLFQQKLDPHFTVQ